MKLRITAALLVALTPNFPAYAAERPVADATFSKQVSVIWCRTDSLSIVDADGATPLIPLHDDDRPESFILDVQRSLIQSTTGWEEKLKGKPNEARISASAESNSADFARYKVVYGNKTISIALWFKSGTYPGGKSAVQEHAKEYDRKIVYYGTCRSRGGQEYAW